MSSVAIHHCAIIEPAEKLATPCKWLAAHLEGPLGALRAHSLCLISVNV